MPEILVVGSLAYDTIATPEGRVDRALGGSANYFSLAASNFAKVHVVGVVGDDYETRHIDLLTKKGVDVSGIERAKGRTFHWEGEYGKDMNEAQTLATELNVFQNFDPKLPEHFRDTPYVFLANIDPELQIKVLQQVRNPKFVALDTMNFWIESKIFALKEVLKRVNAVLMNEGEAKLLTRKTNAISAAEEISKMGPKAIVIKRGEYGFVLFYEGEYFILPAFPIANVVDPTGAGDTFAGGFFGYLAQNSKGTTFSDLKRACVEGCLMASFTVQDFGTARVATVTKDDLVKRHREYSKVVSYEL
ncbi:MAG TPA: PfkB family carbohydrate kinase [Bdellovibrionales bacterium]|nr:PfkB family carbohydrate kinase [Bdellovibrionales bacterium]